MYEEDPARENPKDTEAAREEENGLPAEGVDDDGRNTLEEGIRMFELAKTSEKRIP